MQWRPGTGGAEMLVSNFGYRPAADTATNAFECPSRPFSLSAGVSMNSVRSISAAFGLAIAKSSLVSPDIDDGFEVPRQAA